MKIVLLLCFCAVSSFATLLDVTYIQHCNLGTSDLAGDPYIIWHGIHDTAATSGTNYLRLLDAPILSADAIADEVSPTLAGPFILWGGLDHLQLYGALGATLTTPVNIYYSNQTTFSSCFFACGYEKSSIFTRYNSGPEIFFSASRDSADVTISKIPEPSYALLLGFLLFGVLLSATILKSKR